MTTNDRTRCQCSEDGITICPRDGTVRIVAVDQETGRDIRDTQGYACIEHAAPLLMVLVTTHTIANATWRMIEGPRARAQLDELQRAGIMRPEEQT